MKDIKFRGWNSVTKTMLYLEENAFQSWKIFSDGSFTAVNNRGEHMGFIQSDPYNPHVLMQCVGLQDKKNKLIYEGDIIKEGKSIGEIVYNADSFEISWLTNPESFNNIIKYHCKNFEVLGNKYENPELLNIKKRSKKQL